MTDCLIGYTGFVGGALLKSRSFDARINRANLTELDNKKFERIFCAGLPAEKWKANLHPEKDSNNMTSLIKALSSVETGSFVLISTVDVYETPVQCDETGIPTMTNHAYGKHRLAFEDFIRSRFEQSIVIRLPALFGHGLKKNIVFDLLHKHEVEKINPNTEFQWYPINRLSADIDLLLQRGFTGTINLCPEPLATAELIATCFPEISLSASDMPGARYDVRSRFASLFGSQGHYLQTKEESIQQLQRYIEEFRK